MGNELIKDGALGKCIAIIVGGITLVKIGEINSIGLESAKMLGYGISALGGIAATTVGYKLFNPYMRLFENLKLEKGEQLPKYKGKRKTDYGYCLTFSLPTGLSTDDFKKHQLAIEQNLNKRIDISYRNHRVFIRVFEKELEELIPYEFVETKNPLEFAIGKVFGGKVITLDLEKVVHLLIAGNTGSGKSTLLRSIITSFILSGIGVELYLIDLKNGAEFNVFRKCKHVKRFSKDIATAYGVLMELSEEIDRRYDLFYENDVVDIREYNKLKGMKKLSYKVLVIDEFADFKKEKDHLDMISTLAAKARACGIHLIISTQRPDRFILNGQIKANIPCAIGLKTLNEVNSRIIIDQGGLEKLRGKGNALLSYGDLTEFQGMLITNEQARDLVKHTYIETPIKACNPIEQLDEPKEIEDFEFLEKLG